MKCFPIYRSSLYPDNILSDLARIYPYQDKDLINKIYNKYFTTAYVKTINSANIGKILL